MKITPRVSSISKELYCSKSEYECILYIMTLPLKVRDKDSIQSSKNSESINMGPQL